MGIVEGKGNMERLTFVDEDGQVLFENPSGFPEDVGFTIRELAKNEEWEALDNIAQRLANCEQRLKYYKDLEEQNRLLKLPCEIGQRVYMIYQFCGKGAWEIEEHKIRLEDLRNIGKTVFLTREEAEAALKELEDKEE